MTLTNRERQTAYRMRVAAHIRRLEALARRVADLNRDAGEIGAGMLAQLVDEARAIVGPPTVSRSQPTMAEQHAALVAVAEAWADRCDLNATEWDACSEDVEAIRRADGLAVMAVKAVEAVKAAGL